MVLKNKISAVILGCLLLTSPLAIAQDHQNLWIEAKSISGNFKAVTTQPDIEIFSAPNVIMLKVNENVEVRLFTILGKLISAQQLEPGIFQFNMDTHGIYIIKTDKTSCKIAI
ncbi:MAG: hypothetical protein J1F67_00110 [Muribaculaceae bacterium]|nr:hypothetical protein [Muribaculaceae bacterium]